MFIEKGTWQVPFDKRDDHLNYWKNMTKQQRENRDIWIFKSSRFFKKYNFEESIEYWTFIDEFESEEQFLKMREKISRLLETEEGKNARKIFNSVIVPGSMKLMTYTELKELHVE